MNAPKLPVLALLVAALVACRSEPTAPEKVPPANGSGSGSGAGSASAVADIDFPDAIVALYDKRTGFVKVVFCDHDNSKYVSRGTDSEPRIDRLKVALTTRGAIQLVTSNRNMRAICKDLRTWRFYEHAVADTDASLAKVLPGAAIVVEQDGKLWRMDKPAPDARGGHMNAYLSCRTGLIKWAQKIPQSGNVSRRASDSPMGWGN